MKIITEQRYNELSITKEIIEFKYSDKNEKAKEVIEKIDRVLNEFEDGVDSTLVNRQEERDADFAMIRKHEEYLNNVDYLEDDCVERELAQGFEGFRGV